MKSEVRQQTFWEIVWESTKVGNEAVVGIGTVLGFLFGFISAVAAKIHQKMNHTPTSINGQKKNHQRLRQAK